MPNTVNRTANIYINGSQAGASIKEMRSEWHKLNREVAHLDTNTQEYIQKTRRMRELDGHLAAHRRNVRSVGGAWETIKKEVKSFGMIAIGALGAQQLLSGIDRLVERNAKLDDSFADVMKTTGLTKAEVKDLYQELGKIDTRSSRNELLALARDAGKLGITGQKNIAEFVRQADMINVALGEDLGDGAILKMKKLSDVFDVEMTRIGSAINTIGASSSANEGYMVDFLSRLGGVGKTAGISAPDILGYGAALDSMGLQAEMSSTALSNFFIDFLKNSSKFEAAAGMAKGSLEQLIGDEGANAGFLAFIQSLKESSSSSEEFLSKLEAIGVDGSRGAQVFLSLANNIEMVKDQQGIANDAFDKGTSILDEFNTKNETLAAKLERVQRWLRSAFINSGVVEAVEGMVGAIDDYIRQPMSEKLQEERMELNLLVRALASNNEESETRSTLLSEIKSKYPDYVKLVNIDTASTEELYAALEKVNTQMIQRIILQEQEEKLQKQSEKAAQAFRDDYEQRKKIFELLNKAVLDFGVNLDETMDIEDQVNDVMRQLREMGMGGTLFDPKARIYHQLNEATYGMFGGVKATNNEYERQLKILEELQLETEELRKSLELPTSNTTSTDSSDSTSTNLVDAGFDNSKPGKEPKEKKDKKLEEYMKFLQEIDQLNQENILKQIDEDTAEIERIRQKYALLIEESRKYHEEGNWQELELQRLRDDEIEAYTLQRKEMWNQQLQELLNSHDATDLERQKQKALEELKIEEQQALNLSQKLNQTESERTRIKQHFEQQRLAITQKFAQAEINMQRAKTQEILRQRSMELDAVSSLLNDIGGMMNKESEAFKGLMAAQGAISAISSAIKAYEATVGIPIVGPFLAPIKAAAAFGFGMAKVSMINNQDMPSYPSFATGGFFSGFTGAGGATDSTGQPVAGVAKLHGNEWVSPAWMTTQSPTAEIIGVLEQFRQNKGMAAGGFASEALANNPQGSSSSTSPDALYQAIIRLNTHLDRGIMARIDMFQWEDDQSEYQRIRDRASG